PTVNPAVCLWLNYSCFSSVGNRRVGKQRLSIGNNCDRLGTVEHEFLHALGFWHEQSRADRDDYVNIIWDQIEPGTLVSVSVSVSVSVVSSALGVPYDYGSVMHYSKTSFNIATAPTIVTKIPEFMDVSCNFEELNICGMIQDPSNKWEQRMAVGAGPQTDFSSMGQCIGNGRFMHFSTASGMAGNRGFLESRILYTQPGTQCLQFFLYNSGGAGDALNIWLREYDQQYPDGHLQLFKTITPGSKGSWELHHVTLPTTKKSRVVFEGVKGDSFASVGGLSLDDVNLWAGRCPQHVWNVRNITGLLATTPVGTKVYSPRFLSPSGYSFQVGVYLNGKDRPGTMGIYLYLTSGPNDDKLKWPCPWHQATMALMDQQSDVRSRMNMYRMITTDPNKLSGSEYFWDRPSKVGSLVSGPEGSYYRGPGTGTSGFLTHSRLHSRKFIKGDDAFFLLSL
ncbi:hypothetical protein CRUP_037682, partial [Coryphaenoides rupestris]